MTAFELTRRLGRVRRQRDGPGVWADATFGMALRTAEELAKARAERDEALAEVARLHDMLHRVRALSLDHAITCEAGRGGFWPPCDCGRDELLAEIEALVEEGDDE